MIRFAIWAAVSTREQAAEDKASLDVQVEACRAIAHERGWVEAAEPFIVPGESRTRWVNLVDAERAIPQLKQLMDEAQAGKFDVVLVHEYDRLRELLDPVARTLSHYKVQLVSASQFIEPVDPQTYNPYASDSESFLRGMSAMFSRAAVAGLRRKYLANMPKRISERGLPVIIPWGYRRPPGHETNRSAVPEQNPEIIPHLLMMKTMFLGGCSTYQIAAELDRLGVPLPRGKGPWVATTVRRILTNPFYAGHVRWGVSKSTLDPRQGKVQRTWNDPGRVVTARGKHQPAWDDATLAAIEAEFDRRGPGHRGHITRQLSSLMYCSICGAMLWRHRRGSRNDVAKYVITWRCSKGAASHIVVTNDLMLERVVVELERHLQEQQAQPIGRSPENELRELRARRARIGDGYEAGLFDLAEFSRRTSAVDEAITRLENQEKTEYAQQAEAAARARVVELLRSIGDQVSLAEYIRNGNKQEVNTALHQLIDKLIVDPQGNIIKLIPHPIKSPSSL